jgi:hypothetical protein
VSKVNKYKYYAKNLFENWTNNKETCSISSRGWRLQGGILSPVANTFCSKPCKTMFKSFKIPIDNQTKHNNETPSPSFVHNFCTMAGETHDSIELWSSFSVGPWQREFLPQWAG